MSDEQSSSELTAAPSSRFSLRRTLGRGDVRIAVAAAAILAIAFAIGSLVVAPVAIDAAIARRIAAVPGRRADVERIAVNPFTLTVALSGVALEDAATATSARIETMRLDFAVVSLFTSRVVLDDLAIDGADARVGPVPGVDAAGALKQAVAAWLPARPVRVERVMLTARRFTVVDQTERGGRTLAFVDVEASATNLASDPDERGAFVLTARDDSGGAWRLEGEIAAATFASSGRIAVEHVDLERLRPWLGERARAVRVEGAVDGAADYEWTGGALRFTEVTAGVTALVLEPWADARFAAAAVALRGRVDIGLAAADSTYAAAGDIDIEEAALEDSTGTLIAWRHAALSGVAVPPHEGAESSGIAIDKLRIEGASTAIAIAPAGQSGAEPAWPTMLRARVAAALGYRMGPEAAVRITTIEVDDGRIDVVDTGLSPPVAFPLTELGAVLRRAGRTGPEPGMELQGTLGESGTVSYAAQFGSSEAEAAEQIRFTARGVDAAVLARYVRSHAGRAPTSGSIDFDVDYRRRGGDVVGAARIGAIDLVLGAPADSADEPGRVDGAADAGSSASRVTDATAGERASAIGRALPLDLALALLEDPAGRIEVTLPIAVDRQASVAEARSDDAGAAATAAERGSAGGVEAGTDHRDGAADAGSQRPVVDAIVAGLSTVVRDVTAAPFDVLGMLAGRSGDTLDAVAFAPGLADPAEGGRESLAALAVALGQRPALKLRVAGRADPQLDRDALAAQQIELHVALDLAGPTRIARPQPIDFMSERTWQLLDEFAGERLAAEEVATIESYFTRDASGRVVEAEKSSYYRALFDALVENEEIDRSSLARLARYRAQSIANALGANGIAAERIELAEPIVASTATEAADDGAAGSDGAAAAESPAEGEGTTGGDDATSTPAIEVPLELLPLARPSADASPARLEAPER